ncbi:MAG: hypothetical protein R3296_03955 [Oleiphilaceae bacterium]|nr:hypothetical protein [Oleiphilaceae bacterium]
MPVPGHLRPTAPLLLALLVLVLPQQALSQPGWETLEQSFASGARHDRLWSRTWATLYGGSAITGAVLASTYGRATQRYDARVRTVTSTLALADTLMNPLPHRPAYSEFRKLREQNPDSPLSLEQARALAREVARTEQHRHQWHQRIGAVLVNTAAGLVIGVGDNRPRDGWSTALSGMITSELNIRTQPRQLSRTKGLKLKLGQTSVILHPHVMVTPNQLALSVRF